MTLSVGLGIAQSALSVTADQTAVVSRNVANASDLLASRKAANVVTAPGGGIRLASITRVTNDVLFKNVLTATSVSSGQAAIVDALDQLDQTINDPELDASPAALIGKLTAALQHYAESPNDVVRARSALSAAATLATGLNNATQTVQQVRQQADDEIARSVDRINGLLSQFQELNGAIVKGTKAGADVTDQLDARDRVLAGLAEEVGIRTVSRADGDLALYTDSGVTLFDVTARNVTFQRTIGFAASTTGNPVFIDGVAVIGSGATLPLGSGRLSGLAVIRDDVAVTYQAQLDEIARGLIEAFAESDQSVPPTLPDAAGLFTYPGGPAVLASGVLVSGLAGVIRVNPNVDPAQGGNLNRLRDGGIAGAAYVYNTTGAAGYSDRLQQLVDEALRNRPFDPVAQLGSAATVSGLATASIASLQEARRSANAEAEFRATVLSRSSEALSNVSGISLDEELTILLELERAYQASSRVISTIDGLFDALLAVV